MHFLNYLHCYSNVSRLTRSVLGEKITNPSELHSKYRLAISKLRKISCPENGYVVSFEDDHMGSHISSTGIFDEIFAGVRNTTKEERTKFIDLVSAAFDLLESIDSKLTAIVRLLVTDIVCLKAKREGGGSASHLPGLVCISPGESWGAGEIAESLLHEATHLNLFVADMVNGLFVFPLSRLEEDDARVVSAVRVGQLRPLDKAFHSAAVAVPLMYIQNVQGKTSLIDMFSESLKVCANGLMQKSSFLSDYGNLLVNQLHDFSVAPDFEKVRHAIGAIEYSSYP
jgi:hypothetical protein